MEVQVSTGVVHSTADNRRTRHHAWLTSLLQSFTLKRIFLEAVGAIKPAAAMLVLQYCCCFKHHLCFLFVGSKQLLQGPRPAVFCKGK